VKIWSDREEYYREKGINLKKIGERHGEMMSDKYKPKDQKDRTYYDLPKKEKRSIAQKFKKNLRENAPKEELFFRSMLMNCGIFHYFQYSVMDNNNFVIADFYIPKIHLIVEIDGGYHETPKQKKRDEYKDKFYKKSKFNVIRIRNEDVENFNYNLLKEWVSLGFIDSKYKPLLAVNGWGFGETPKYIKENKSGRKKKKLSYKVTKKGVPCRKCGTRVVKRKTMGRYRRKGQRYGFKYNFYCPNCKTIYNDESSKFYF